MRSHASCFFDILLIAIRTNVFEKIFFVNNFCIFLQEVKDVRIYMSDDSIKSESKRCANGCGKGKIHIVRDVETDYEKMRLRPIFKIHLSGW